MTPQPVNYASPAVRTSPHWAPVALIPDASLWHAARALLAQHGIVSRVGELDDGQPGMMLEVFHTEVEWARDILERGLPQLAGLALPAGGFPITPLPGHPTPSTGTTPIEPQNVLPLPSPRSPPQDSPLAHRLFILFLWLALAAIIVSMIVVSFMDAGV